MASPRDSLFSNWFNFNTREIVIMAIMVAVTGVFQTLWAHLVFQAQMLGPFSNLFASYGFNVASFLVLYLVGRPGTATTVKFFASLIELALGNPVGPVVIFYGTIEGFAADLAFVLFRRKINLSTVITGSLLAWIFTAPVDAYRDKVPLTVEAMVAYFGPGGAGKVWISLWVYWTILLLQKIGIEPTTRHEVVVEDIGPAS